jgi:hypothetical protein
MPLLTSIVDLDSIHVNKSDSFSKPSDVEIEALANTIIQIEGSINIPVVYQISIDEYELMGGHIGYLAYQRAYEIKPSIPDRLVVFVADKKNKSIIDQQLKILNLLHPSQKESSSKQSTGESHLDLQLSNLASLIRQNHKELSSGFQTLSNEFRSDLSSKLPQPLPPIEAFNQILDPQVALKMQRKLEFLGVGKARKIVQQLQDVSKTKEHKPFQNFTEVLDSLAVKQSGRTSRLMSEKKMIELLDRWNS